MEGEAEVQAAVEGAAVEEEAATVERAAVEEEAAAGRPQRNLGTGIAICALENQWVSHSYTHKYCC